MDIPAIKKKEKRLRARRKTLTFKNLILTDSALTTTMDNSHTSLIIKPDLNPVRL